MSKRSGGLLPTLTAGHDYRETKRKPSAEVGTHGKSLAGEIAESTLQPSHLPASRQVVLGSGSENPTHVGSGTRLLRRFKLRNLVGPSSKIQLVSSLLMADWHSKVSSLVWREKVIGRRVLLYLHQRSAPGTEEIEFGLLPTLRAKENCNYQYDRRNHAKPRLSLKGRVELLRRLPRAT